MLVGPEDVTVLPRTGKIHVADSRILETFLHHILYHNLDPNTHIIFSGHPLWHPWKGVFEELLSLQQRQGSLTT